VFFVMRRAAGIPEAIEMDAALGFALIEHQLTVDRVAPGQARPAQRLERGGRLRVQALARDRVWQRKVQNPSEFFAEEKEPL
jgi:hypothetical protein